MIVLDASVLIAHFSPHDAHSERALEILDTEEDVAMHHLTMAEVLAGPARNGTEQEVALAIPRLGIEALEVEPDEPLRTARIRASTGLRMPDACVLSAALRLGSALATFDGRLARAARASGVSRVLSHLDDVEA